MIKLNNGLYNIKNAKDTRQAKPLQIHNLVGHSQVVDMTTASDNNLLCKLDLLSGLDCVDIPSKHILVNHIDVLCVEACYNR